MTLPIKELRAKAEAATPGPWQWYGNTKHQEVYLATTYGGRRFVMDFVRWGMSGAQPRFQVVIDGGEAGGGVMRTLAQLAEGDVNAAGRLPVLGPKYEASHRKQFTGIGHADAEYIASFNPATVLALLDRIATLEALLSNPLVDIALGILASDVPPYDRETHTAELRDAIRNALETK